MTQYQYLYVFVVAFLGCSPAAVQSFVNPTTAACASRQQQLLPLYSSFTQDGWNGEVVSNDAGGRIRGCSIRPITPSDENDESSTLMMVVDWELTIDGEQADLGLFSQAIYQKIVRDAKQQRFQGFRPGTIPPHLEPTYRAFAMDECARETVLEALQQNNIRPFSSTRSDMFLKDFQIPPSSSSSSSSKSKKSKKNKSKKTNQEKGMDDNGTATNEEDTVVATEAKPEQEKAWRTFDTMKEAIDAGWRPGQSFSFVAVNVKGQKVKDQEQGAKPVGGLNY